MPGNPPPDMPTMSFFPIGDEKAIRSSAMPSPTCSVQKSLKTVPCLAISKKVSFTVRSRPSASFTLVKQKSVARFPLFRHSSIVPMACGLTKGSGG